MRQVKTVRKKIHPINSKSHSISISKFLFFTTLISIFLFALVLERFYTLRITINTGKNEKKLVHYENIYKKHLFEYKKLISHFRLETYAKETLNMIYPNGEYYANAKLSSD